MRMDSSRISIKELQQLLRYFSTSTYRARETNPVATEAMNKCIHLVSLDYECSYIDNSTGELSSRYPSHLIVLESEKHASSSEQPSTIYEGTLDAAKMKDAISKARIARCRSRFPVPVILFRGKHICRSSTLSGGPELYGRCGFNFLFSSSGNNSPSPPSTVEHEDDLDEETEIDALKPGEWPLFDKVRNKDIKLLKMLNIGTIIDFMVEKKKIKFGVYVTSSEKVDKENRYNDFKILSLPYPGCEFFKEFRDNTHCSDGLLYDWSDPQVDTGLDIPEDDFLSQLKLDWSKYQKWDLTELTKNYMLLILSYVHESNDGLLLHCISGWDRTPLFISLLRLSLWADNLVHQSLSAADILYLTLAYDWMLFGHHLSDRLSRGEEILFFCFHFLTHLSENEFSLLRPRKRSPMVSTSARHESESSSFADFDDLEEKILYTQESSVSSSLSSSRSEEQPVVYSNLPAYMEQSQYGASSASECTWEPSVMPTESKPAESEVVSTCDLLSSSPILISSPRPVESHSSPVAVPRARIRSRHDSNGSVAGSWQIITDHGSFRTGYTCGMADSAVFARNSMMSNKAAEDMANSSITVIENENSATDPILGEYPHTRKEKLKAVQSLFFNIYHSMTPMPAERISLTSIFGNFAERVGIFQTAHS
ncbi:Hypothetical predicted protein [Cloeon dipterum]|uniref:Myotubularin phosphatase domain-containing protein n=4 Tax=Cloeon dipterum TaxID=197152 RepID=A0A8S1DLG5_9INSE|nr:Hypothetical predicted protein [Cloeon dipterum]